jgi:hypothetical protein
MGKRRRRGVVLVFVLAALWWLLDGWLRPLGPGADAIDADTAAGYRYRSEGAAREGRLGVALVELERARQRQPSAEARAVLDAAQARVDGELRAALDRTATQVREGLVLDAEAGLLRLREGAHPRVAAELAARAQREGWPAWLTAVPAQGSRQAPASAAGRPSLAAGRRVRAWHEGALLSGTVVASDGDRATVRCAGEHGDRFPELPFGDLAPAGPSDAEAMQFARAALPRSLLRAALWCTFLGERGGQEAEQLRAAIRASDSTGRH